MFFKLISEFAAIQKMAHWIRTVFKSVYKIEVHSHCVHFLQFLYTKFCAILLQITLPGQLQIGFVSYFTEVSISLRVLRMQAQAEMVFSKLPAMQPT